MKITRKGIQPCSNCLRARNRIQQIANAMSKRWGSANVEIECQNGTITIMNTTKTIIAVGGSGSFNDLLGREVYVGGRWVFDIVKADKITALGPIVKMTPVG